MPPKSFSKRGGKIRPLNPLERKVRKRKHELIHKATVKKQYYKSIEKENPQDDTPDYVKEIFGEKTIDEDGNVVAYDSGNNNNNNNAKSAFEEEKEQDKVHYLDEASSSEEEEEEEDKDEDDEAEEGSKKKRKIIDNEPKQYKPNPFKSQIEDRNKSRKLTQEQREKRDKDFAQQAKERQKYYSKRRRERSQMLAKNSKGQPKMAQQMDCLLEKIQKQMNA